jgi:hypothetical protein
MRFMSCPVQLTADRSPGLIRLNCGAMHALADLPRHGICIMLPLFF